MQFKIKKALYIILCIPLILAAGCGQKDIPPDLSRGTVHNLTVMSTTDEHQQLLPYNYMEDEEDGTIGLSKVYSVVEEIRGENVNTLLFSSGDVIQGSLIGELESIVDPLKDDEYQTIIKAFNLMGYDGVAVGNHDLTDFGMEFFERARNNSDFPWLSANIKLARSPDEFFVKPYTIIEKTVDGIPLNVGIIGFVPPQIMTWGRRHLKGELIVKDIVTQAEKYIPELREKSDIVIAVAHSGIDDSPEARENAGYHLAGIEGIDLLLLGHQHNKFPGDYGHIDRIDEDKGLIRGVPAMLPSSWGRAVGVAHLELFYSAEGQWSVIDGKTKLRETEPYPSHPEIEELADDIHSKTLEYIRTPIGETEVELVSYFSRIKDSALTQIINNAQLWYGADIIEGTKYEDIPLLSAAAAFVAGREGPDYYTRVSGEITIGDVTDIYIYPNTVEIVKVTGKQLKDYLEYTAENFKTTDTQSETPGHLVNYDRRAFNYDIIEGIEYTIDVTEPPGNRIEKIIHQGESVAADMEFLIVMNNYRASGGGDFPHMTGENAAFSTTDVNREIIIEYIRKMEAVNPQPTGNWRIKPETTKGPVLFRSSPAGREYLIRKNLPGISYLETDESGWGIYKIDLTDINR